VRDMRAAAEEFLAQDRIAVAGVSRDPRQPANAIYRRLRDAGHTVFALNPSAEAVEGDPCWATVAALPVKPDGVLIATHPEVAAAVARECAAAGVPRVWMHRSFGVGSVSDEATAACRDAGIAVLDGGCPLMFAEPVDPAHRCFRWILGVTGGLPDGAAYERALDSRAPEARG
jgi:predicted CoA-binding protein